jgi:hypothetical protein
MLPLVKLPRVEVILEPRFKKSSGQRARLLMARIVEWIPGDEGIEPVFGRCLLSPNQITDVELAKRIVTRWLGQKTDKIEFKILGV